MYLFRFCIELMTITDFSRWNGLSLIDEYTVNGASEQFPCEKPTLFAWAKENKFKSDEIFLVPISWTHFDKYKGE